MGVGQVATGVKVPAWQSDEVCRLVDPTVFVQVPAVSQRPQPEFGQEPAYVQARPLHWSALAQPTAPAPKHVERFTLVTQVAVAALQQEPRRDSAVAPRK